MAIIGTSSLIDAIFSKEATAARSAGGKSGRQVLPRTFEESQKGLAKSTAIEEWKNVKVHSNYAREMVVVLSDGTPVLKFNQFGDAEMAECYLPVLQAEMRSRPGRYSYEVEKPYVAPLMFVEEVPEVKQQVSELLEKLKEAKALNPPSVFEELIEISLPEEPVEELIEVSPLEEPIVEEPVVFVDPAPVVPALNKKVRIPKPKKSHSRR